MTLHTTQPPDQPDDEWLFDEVPENRNLTSEKQIRANRENAQKATGPTSAEGKARSSQNARKHNIFTTSVEPVRNGAFAEDDEELHDRVQAIVNSLRPRDAIESAVAAQIAGVMIRLERLDRWANATIESASVMTISDYELGLRPRALVERLEGVARGCFYFLAGMHSTPDYEGYASLIRYQGPDPEVVVKGLWDKNITPSTDDEWRRAFLALKAHHWDTDAAALAWAHEKSMRLGHRLQQLDGYERSTSAERIMAKPFDRQILYSTRLSNTLRTLNQEYERLRSRNLDDTG